MKILLAAVLIWIGCLGLCSVGPVEAQTRDLEALLLAQIFVSEASFAQTI